MDIGVFIRERKGWTSMVVARALARILWKRGILMTEKHHMAAILSIELGLVATSIHGIPQNVSLLSFCKLKKGHTLLEPKKNPYRQSITTAIYVNSPGENVSSSYCYVDMKVAGRM